MRLKIIQGLSFRILWGDNVYEFIWRYFKYCIVRLRVQGALHKIAKDVSIASILQSDQTTERAKYKAVLIVANLLLYQIDMTFA